MKNLELNCLKCYYWGIDFEKMESDGLLKLFVYPESTGLEDHLQIIKTQINQFKPKHGNRLFGISPRCKFKCI